MFVWVDGCLVFCCSLDVCFVSLRLSFFVVAVGMYCDLVVALLI